MDDLLVALLEADNESSANFVLVHVLGGGNIVIADRKILKSGGVVVCAI